MDDLSSLDDFTKKLIPITYFRRNAGEVMARLPKAGTFILTKDGKPVAKLSIMDNMKIEQTTEEKLKTLRRLAGGFNLGKGMTPSQMNKLLDKRYEEMLPR